MTSYPAIQSRTLTGAPEGSRDATTAFTCNLVRHRMSVKALILSAAALALTACGISYSIEPARFLLTGDQSLSRQRVLLAVGDLLQHEGFEELGIAQEMIALLERNPAVSDWMLSNLRNQFTYLNKQRNLRVVVTDYSDTRTKRSALAYEAPAGAFFEISVYESRPGGFSTEGHRFTSMLRGELERSLKTSITVATPPPTTNQAEYWRITIVNGFTLAFQWALVFLITVAATGAITFFAVKRLSLSRRVKQGIFVLVNTWLATPLPFPVATILVALLPNLVAFPWADADYYQRVQDVAAVSFPISLVLCFLISLRVFPKSNAETISDRENG